MTTERDPLLESFFDAADTAPDNDEFTDSVVRQMKKRRHRVLLGRVAVLALLVLLEILLESPLKTSLGIAAEVLGRSLVDVDGEWLAFLLAPVNSIAGIVGVTLLALNLLYRRLFY
jgi:hypothetical protein